MCKNKEPETAVVVHEPKAITPNGAEFLPVMDLQIAVQRRQAVVDLVSEKVLVEGQDYGKVPGTQRPTLLKPGAEKLSAFFGLEPDVKSVEEVKDWTGENHGGEPFFYFKFRYTLHRNGKQLGVGIGSANSWESKYRYRWVAEHDVPAGTKVFSHKDGSITEPAFAINRKETSGRYGKPIEYWNKFDDAIQRGIAVEGDREKKDNPGETYKTWTIPGVVCRVANPDVADQVNTIEKMAFKRAQVAATLNATGASEMFTQDVEDMDTSGIDTGPHPKGTQAAADHVAQQKIDGTKKKPAAKETKTIPITPTKPPASEDSPDHPEELQNIIGAMFTNGKIDRESVIKVMTGAKIAISDVTGNDEDFHRILGKYAMKDEMDLKGKRVADFKNIVRELYWFVYEWNKKAQEAEKQKSEGAVFGQRPAPEEYQATDDDVPSNIGGPPSEEIGGESGAQDLPFDTLPERK